jgi:hypothetical protein
VTRKLAPEPPEGVAAAERNEWERVWRRVVADPAIKLVGWTAASWAEPDGTRIFPGARLLAATTGLSETTVKNALAVIRQSGLIWRYVEGSKHGRGGLADEYRLTIPDDILDRVPMLTPDYEPTGTGRLRTRDIRTRDLSDRNRSSEVQEQVVSGDATTYRTTPAPLHVEDPAASRRDHPAAQRGPGAKTHRGIAPDFIGDVARQLTAELRPNASETRAITAMLERGAHTEAVRNTITKRRFGPRSERRRSGDACPHGRPYARVDGLSDCAHDCYRAPVLQLVPDDWSSAESEDSGCLRELHGCSGSRSAPTTREAVSDASSSPRPTCSTPRPAGRYSAWAVSFFSAASGPPAACIASPSSAGTMAARTLPRWVRKMQRRSRRTDATSSVRLARASEMATFSSSIGAVYQKACLYN